MGLERALNRPPTQRERRVLQGLYSSSLAEFRSAPAARGQPDPRRRAPVPGELKPAELAAMTTVARAILNMHETITRN